MQTLSPIRLKIVDFAVLAATALALITVWLMKPEASPKGSAQDVGEYVYVAGAIDLGEGGRSVFRTIKRTRHPLATALAWDERKQEQIKSQGLTSPYTLTVEGHGGRVLFERVLVRRGTHHGPSETLWFNELIPYPEGAAGLRIRRGRDVLNERRPSAHAPQVTVLSPNGGETARGPMVIRWQAADADHDPLTYDILYSADGGSTWRALAIDYRESTLTLEDTKDLPGTNHALIRVIAADGFNTGEDHSDSSFTVPNKPPSVVILSPASDSAIQGRTVVFHGAAFDREDGPLNEHVLQWESDEDGHLGVGREVATRRSALESTGLH